MRCLRLAALLAFTYPAASAAADPVVDAIAKAQAAQQAARAYKVSWRSTALTPGRVSTTTLIVAPPDRYHLFDHDAVPPLEIIRIGSKAWMKMGASSWSEAPSPFTMETFHGPARVDDWTYELREARALGARDVKGQPTHAYQYALAVDDVTTPVRIFVADATGLPVRYEQDEKGGSVSWDIEYEPGLAVMPPPGQAFLEGPAPRRIANFPRITLAETRSAAPMGDETARLPVVIARADGSLRIGSKDVHDAPAISAALRALLAGSRTRDEFLLYAGHDVPFALIETLMDAAREAGVSRASLGVRSMVGERVLRLRIHGPSRADPPAGWLIARSVSGQGRGQVVSLNKSEASLDDFDARLRDVLTYRRDKSVDVFADTPRKFQDVVWLIDTIAGAGGEPVLLTTAVAAVSAPPPPPPPPRR